MMMLIIIIIIIIIVFRLSERLETLTGAACILFVTLKCRQNVGDVITFPSKTLHKDYLLGPK